MPLQSAENELTPPPVANAVGSFRDGDLASLSRGSWTDLGNVQLSLLPPGKGDACALMKKTALTLTTFKGFVVTSNADQCYGDDNTI